MSQRGRGAAGVAEAGRGGRGSGRQQSVQQPREAKFGRVSGELVESAMYQYAPDQKPLPMVDIGVNLADKHFVRDVDDVLRRAAAAGVAGIIITGCCLRTSRRAQTVVAEHAHGSVALYSTAGVHPHNAKSCDADTVPELRRLLQHPRCVAVGECGLDFDRMFSPRDVQLQWFEQQLELAVEVAKPLFLHCRAAEEDFHRVLARYAPRLRAPAVVHCYTGGREEVERLVALGCYVGVTGWICDERDGRGEGLAALVRDVIPRDRLMIETDAPWLTPRCITPSRQRPRRNEPALLPLVCEAVARALDMTMEEVAALTTANACRVFGLELRA
ncbi:unnamed protein product [Pedinophyceae sp. YPF-701]|nr:unnamed protein product [Pedinophyceae sp. YPF-701]